MSTFCCECCRPMADSYKFCPHCGGEQPEAVKPQMSQVHPDNHNTFGLWKVTTHADEDGRQKTLGIYRGHIDTIARYLQPKAEGGWGSPQLTFHLVVVHEMDDVTELSAEHGSLNINVRRCQNANDDEVMLATYRHIFRERPIVIDTVRGNTLTITW